MSMKEVPKLFRNVKEELWNKLHDELILLRATHPAYRDDQLLLFMLCKREAVEAKFPLVLEEMTQAQLVEWAAGTLMMAIGRGDFKGSLSGILIAVQTMAWGRGVSTAKKLEKTKVSRKK